MIQTNWSKERKRLYRQARHQVLVSRMAEHYSPFDAEGNVVSDERPGDFKRHWAGLTETERAFEILERTDCAIYMEFYNRIKNSIPGDADMIETTPIIIKP
jgi:hypothetical protein